jgi:hypothetical protein
MNNTPCRHEDVYSITCNHERWACPPGTKHHYCSTCGQGISEQRIDFDAAVNELQRQYEALTGNEIKMGMGKGYRLREIARGLEELAKKFDPPKQTAGK